MLRLLPFRYVAPSTLDDAVRRLAEAGSAAAAMSGGTDLLPHMKRGVRRADVVVGLRHLRELQGIRVSNDGTAIGAACTLAEVARHPQVRRRFPSFARTVDLVATATLREMGTVGGNLCVETRCTYFDLPPYSRAAAGSCLKDGGVTCLAAPRSARCWATASSDCAPMLIALGARVRVIGPQGDRVIALEMLYQDDGLRPLRLGPGEVVAEILLPAADGVRAAYYKFRRRGAVDFALAAAAVAFRADAQGRIEAAHIVLNGVNSAPVVCTDAARILIGQRIEPDVEPGVLEAAAAAASRAARPLDNADLGAGWRKHAAHVAVARAVREAAGTTGRDGV